MNDEVVGTRQAVISARPRDWKGRNAEIGSVQADNPPSDEALYHTQIHCSAHFACTEKMPQINRMRQLRRRAPKKSSPRRINRFRMSRPNSTPVHLTVMDAQKMEPSLQAVAISEHSLFQHKQTLRTTFTVLMEAAVHMNSDIVTMHAVAQKDV
jgi:hypothetical protein